MQNLNSFFDLLVRWSKEVFGNFSQRKTKGPKPVGWSLTEACKSACKCSD